MKGDEQPRKPIGNKKLLEEAERYRAELREMGRETTFAEAVTIAACFRAAAVDTMDEGVAHVGTVDLTYPEFIQLFRCLASMSFEDNPALTAAVLLSESFRRGGSDS